MVTITTTTTTATTQIYYKLRDVMRGYNLSFGAGRIGSLVSCRLFLVDDDDDDNGNVIKMVY